MQRRMNQARIGVAAVIGFLILLGGLLFMYMSENRSLRKQVEVLSTSLEDVKEKRSSLESEHTDCLIQHKKTSEEKSEVSSKLEECDASKEKVEEQRDEFDTKIGELKSEIQTYEGKETEFEEEISQLRNKLSEASQSADNLKKEKDAGEAEWKEKLVSCQSGLEKCQKDLETAKSTPPPTTSSPASIASQEAPAKEEDSEENAKETDNSVNLDDEQYQNTEEDTNEPTE